MPSLRYNLFTIFQSVSEGFYSIKCVGIKLMLVFSNLSELPFVKGENGGDYMQGGRDEEKGRSQISIYVSLTSMGLIEFYFTHG